LNFDSSSKELVNRKIQQVFKASNYMVWTSKKLVAEKGILSSPNVKPGKNYCLLHQVKW
jgi:hypothetical protein